MTASASCREPRRVLGSLQLGIWAQERSDRRGQDKARKVRAVGRDTQHQKIPAIRQHCAIASAPCDLRERVIATQISTPCEPKMTGNDDFRIRPGRIRSTRALVQNRSWRRRSKPRRRPAVSRGSAGGAAARLGRAARRALPRRGSWAAAPAAPSSRRGSCARCARRARCAPISDILSATG